MPIPEFFSLHGRFTTTGALRDELANLRKAVEAEIAICFALHEHKPFFQICLASCSDPMLEPTLDKALRDMLEGKSEDICKEIAQCRSGDQLSDLEFEQMLRKAHTVVSRQTSRPEVWRVVRCDSDDLWRDRLDGASKDRYEVDLVCFVSGEGPRPPMAHMQAMFLAANCSLPVATERLHQIAINVDKKMDKAIAAFESFDNQAASSGNSFDHVAEAAAELLASDSVHIFEYSRRQGRLIRKASHSRGAVPRSCLRSVEVRGDSSNLTLPWTVLYEVYRKGKIIMLNEEDPLERQALGWRQESAEESARPLVLVVPIIERFYGQVEYRTRGIVVFEKEWKSEDTRLQRGFSHFDLIKARIIANRLTNALDRAKRVTAERAMEVLTRDLNAAVDPPPINWSELALELEHGMAGQGDEAETRARDKSLNGLFDVPADLLRARSRLQQLVVKIPEWFECDFVVLRLFSANLQKLVVVASSDKVPNNLPDLPVHTAGNQPQSIAAKVATEAVAVQATRSEHPGNKWFDMDGKPVLNVITGEHNKDVFAVLSVPLISSGRVIGTLTFESTYRYAFQGDIAWARRLAGSVSHALTVARASASARVLSMSSLLAVKLHGVKKAVNELWDVGQGKIEDSRVILERVHKALDELLPIVGGPPAGAAFRDTSRNDPDWLQILEQRASISIKELALAVLGELRSSRGYDTKLLINELDGVADCQIGEAHVRPVALAIHSVMDNVLLRSQADRYVYFRKGKRRAVRLVGDSIRLWSLSFVNLTIMGPAVEERLLRFLYQFPFQRQGTGQLPGRPSLGAFIAGAGMRNIGGDIFVEKWTPEFMSTVIQIPLTTRDSHASLEDSDRGR